MVICEHLVHIFSPINKSVWILVPLVICMWVRTRSRWPILLGPRVLQPLVVVHFPLYAAVYFVLNFTCVLDGLVGSGVGLAVDGAEVPGHSLAVLVFDAQALASH